jgi:hypothetical protein
MLVCKVVTIQNHHCQTTSRRLANIAEGMGNSKGLLEMSLDEYKQLMSVNGMI